MITALHASLHFWIAANAAAMRDHVLFSTLLLALLLAISALPFVRPRTRYALILLGVAKFLVPAAVLPVARLFPMRSVGLPAVSMTEVFALPSQTTTQSEILCVVAAIWLAGALLIALRALAAHRQWTFLARSAGTASQRERDAMDFVAVRSKLRSTPRLARAAAPVPLAAGILRPVILLPEHCVDELEDDELRAVLAHELAHVERRHNLGSLAQNAVLALFWFNPLLWIARRALHAEAEKDCDERVLNCVPDSPAYLSGMLKVSYGFIAPQPAGVSCMSTLRLKERMDHLMKHQETPGRSIPHRLAVAIAIAAVALTTIIVSAGEPSKAPVPAGKKGVTLPKLVTKVEPVYPEAARQQRLQGIVVVLATIDETGNVVDASIAKGIEGADGKALEDAAVAAVKQWKFEPALKKGKPVTVTFKITVRFKLS